MLSKMNLRKATLEDLELLVKLRIDFFQELELLESEKNCQCLSQRTRDYFSRKMETNELHTWLVLDKNNIAAVGSLLINEMPPTLGCYGGGIEGYLFNVYTLPEYRKRGIATFLTKYILQEAKNQKCARVWLMYSDERAQRIYDKLDFKLRNDVMDIFL